ncbi:MAG: enoyl-CoA hydratase/isomerase family protein, partial [Thermoleophilaceae bacterium]
PRALELAGRAGADPELSRRIARSMRLQLGPPAVGWPVAVEAERAPQMWSLRRRADRPEP